MKSSTSKSSNPMTQPNQSELVETVLSILGIVDRTSGNRPEQIATLKQELTAHTNAEIAKAKLEAFDVAFDCHDYDRLRAYRAELLKEVK